jgi:hypothetical protein
VGSSQSDWRYGTKSIVVIFGCMDRRLNGTLDDRIKHYKSQGYDVVVFRTAGGNIDPIESEIVEVAATGRLEIIEGFPHHDCGWIRALADALYFDSGAAGKKLGETLRTAGAGIFGDMRIEEKDRKNREVLYAKMEKHLHDYICKAIERIVGAGVDMRINMPDAKTLDTEPKGEAHNHHLVFTIASDLTSKEIADAIGVDTGSMYVLQSLWEKKEVIVPDAWVANKFLKIRDMHFVEEAHNKVKGLLKDKIIGESPFGSDVNRTVHTLSRKTKQRH